MADTILQNFLNQQFIKTSDTDNIAGLKKAVAALKKTLSAKKTLIVPYTLVGLDPQIAETDPVVIEVERVIIKNWPTFKNSTSTDDKATTYVRVVILQALCELANDEMLGTIIWLTGRNIVSYYQLQKERNLIGELLNDIGTQIETSSRKYWSVTNPVINGIEELEINVPTVKNNGFSKDYLVKELKNASVWSGWSNQAGGGENPSYTQAHNFEWARYFSEKAGESITTIVNSAIENQNKTLVTITESIQKDLKEYFAQINQFFSEISSVIGQNAEAANKRGELLWWKQTLFSPSLKTSYRNQPDIISAIGMACDLSYLVGYLYPESVNYLLREALRDVYGDDIDREKSFDHWLRQAEQQSQIGSTLLKPLENQDAGRKSLSAVFANTMLNNKPDSIISETGIDGTLEITLSDLAVWILHDLQAKKISLLKL